MEEHVLCSDPGNMLTCEVVTSPACHQDDKPEDDPIGMNWGNLFILNTFLTYRL